MSTWNERDCPCGSGDGYAACCGPLHAGDATAQTAERLMRSRYSAFVVEDADYLLATWHPSTRPAAVEFDRDVRWRRLRILDASEPDVVEFSAHYWHDGLRSYGAQRERSRFTRVDDRWLYITALEDPAVS